MANAALDGDVAEDGVDGGPERLAAVQDHQYALVAVQAAVDEVGEQPTRRCLFSAEPFHRPSGTLTPSA